MSIIKHIMDSLDKRCINPVSTGIYTSESDVCRRQILTSKVDLHTEIIKIYIMPVDP